VTFGGNVDQKNLDVSVTPDGRYALARADEQSSLHLVELSTGQVRSLELGAVYTALTGTSPATEEDAGVPPALLVNVTDLDLMPGGKRALAVLRNQGAVLEIPLPEAFADPTQIKLTLVPEQVIGSVTISPDGLYAVAYTTVAEFERVVVMDLDKHTPPRAVALRKSVRAVAFTPDGKTALITHNNAPGSPAEIGLTPDQVIDRSFGYSLLRVASADVKLQVTRTKLGPIAMVPDGSYLFILFRDDSLGVKEVQRVALSSFLVDPIIQLENAPISLGTALGSGTVFVNLEHPDGRMTFIDWQQPLEKLKTVTGFELNSRIRD
jgi:WD40 repeat protein